MSQSDRTLDSRRDVPRTDAVLADPRLIVATERLGRGLVKRAVSEALERVRAGAVRPSEAADAAVALLPETATTLRPVINATGVVLHTNLGRAPLSPAAITALATSAGYVDVEFDLPTGQRARRGRGMLSALHSVVPDAEDVLVVNNGAAALLLATATLAAGRELLISRGEMVEIGDGFRLPELIESSGVRLREVGTTNRVRLADYAAAVSAETAGVLKVHPSNFRIAGFTSSVPVHELTRLGVPVIVDVGSGLLAPQPALTDEPDVTSTLRAGAAVVTASGDKLLGGPQAGLVFGATDLVERMRRHPMARALRVDKLTIAALEATVSGPATPTAQALGVEPEQLRRRCTDLAEAVRPAVPSVAVVASAGAVGGGGAPGVELAGWAVALPERFAAALRIGRPAVVGRVEHDRCLLDLRCVTSAEDAAIRGAVLAAAG